MRHHLTSFWLLALLAPAAAAAQSTPAGARICLAPPSAKAPDGGAAGTAHAVRESFTGYLTGPTLSVSPLTAKLESQVREEAKLAGCPWLLLTTVEHKRKKAGGGFLSRAAGGAVQQSAWRAGSLVGGEVGSVAASAVAGAASAAVSEWAYTVKVKDELSLSWRLEDASGAVRAEGKDKRKAEADGEDLLTPQVEAAAIEIAEAVSTRGN